nr:unnamed protein product [Digitaria exilis]
MAIGALVESSAAAGYSGQVTSFVVLSCIVAGSGGILFGYDLGISGWFVVALAYLLPFFQRWNPISLALQSPKAGLCCGPWEEMQVLVGVAHALQL